MFRKNRCYNGGNLHRFEARYSEKSEPQEICASLYNQIPFFEISDCIESNTKREKKYEHDICIWCGKIINKKG